MTSDAAKTVNALKLIRDVFTEFDKLVGSITAMESKYSINFAEVAALNLGEGKTLEVLSEQIGLEKMGLLLLALMKVASIQDGFQNFTNYNPEQRSRFQQELREAVSNLDKVLDGK